MRHGLSRGLLGLLDRVELPGISWRILLLPASAAMMCAGMVGCSSSTAPELTVTSLQSQKTYSQHFSSGYCNRDGHGDTDVVLACDADHPAGHPGVLKQIMHIHVMWTSDRDTKWDGAPDTNASIRWYVFTDHAGQPEIIEYSGAGQVTLISDGEQTSVAVKNASLHPTFARGELTDPIGPSRFQGTISTQSDRTRVNQLLSQVRTTLAATSLPPMPLEARTAEARVPVLP